MAPGAEDAQWKRRRGHRACTRCRTRKVRCDAALNDGQCTNCRLDGAVCTVVKQRQARSNWIDGLKRRRPNGSGHGRASGDASTGSQSPGEQSSSTNKQNENMASADIQMTQKSPNQKLRITTPASFDISMSSGSFPTLGTSSGVGAVDRPSATASSLSGCSMPGCMYGECSQAGHAGGKDFIMPAYISPLPDSIAKEDLEYLGAKGALATPGLPLRNQLLQSFVEYVYPSLPLIDLEDFLSIMLEGDGRRGRVSLLVLQAIMLAGSSFVDLRHLKAAGFQNRTSARRALFQKVKLLYEFDVETSETHLIQALLLMTYGFDESHERKDLWYWMSLVVTLSHSCGLHHCPEREENTEAENRLNRRLWWCVFMRNQFVAFAMRRRARVHYKDRIPMLSVTDFDCGPLPTTITGVWETCLVLREPSLRSQLAMLCIEACKLAVCISEVMSCQFKTRSFMLPLGAGTKSMLVPKENAQSGPYMQRLEEWNQGLPAICRYESALAAHASEYPVVTIHTASLRMLYLSTVSVLHCPKVLPFAPTAASSALAIEAAQDMQDKARTKLRHVASEILQIGMDLHTKDLVHFLPSTSLTPMLSVMLVEYLDFRSFTGQSKSRSLQQYTMAAAIMRKLCDNYPFCQPALAFFETTAMDGNSWLQDSKHAEKQRPKQSDVPVMEAGYGQATTGPNHNVQMPEQLVYQPVIDAGPQYRLENAVVGSFGMIGPEAYMNSVDLSSPKLDVLDSTFDFGVFGSEEDWLLMDGL